MKESTLWDHLKAPLQSSGKFQKVSDRYTPGIPDVLGCFASKSIAIELKELKGVLVIKTKFRPGQLDWLEDWANAGGLSWIISTLGSKVFVHHWSFGCELEKGLTQERLEMTASLHVPQIQGSGWKNFVNTFLCLKDADFNKKEEIGEN